MSEVVIAEEVAGEGGSSFASSLFEEDKGGSGQGESSNLPSARSVIQVANAIIGIASASLELRRVSVKKTQFNEDTARKFYRMGVLLPTPYSIESNNFSQEFKDKYKDFISGNFSKLNGDTYESNRFRQYMLDRRSKALQLGIIPQYYNADNIKLLISRGKVPDKWNYNLTFGQGFDLELLAYVRENNQIGRATQLKNQLRDDRDAAERNLKRLQTLHHNEIIALQKDLIIH